MNLAGTLRLSNRKTVNIMKITVALLLALTMVLSLALVGCGQKDDSSGDSSSVATEQPAATDEPTATPEPEGNVDNKNPKQDADGMYVYNVQGHEIKLSFNVWDYISWVKVNGEQIDNVFYVNRLAEDLGYTIEDPDIAACYFSRYVDGYEVVRAGLWPQGGGNYETIITYRLRESEDKWTWYRSVSVSPYDLDAMTYHNCTLIEQYPINLDMIILCAYCLEYYSVRDTGDCWEDIFGEINVTIPPYELQQSTAPAEDSKSSAGGDAQLSLDDLAGEWEMVGEPNSILIFREEDGAPTIYAEFYRMASFTALLNTLASNDGCLVYETVDGITCRVYPGTDSITVSVDIEDEYYGFFENSEFEYRQQKELTREDWLGKWVSADGSGESITVTGVDTYGIELTFHRLTASGESYTDTDYSLTFEGTSVRWAVEDASVIDASGWRYSFELNDGYIMVYSRYPDQRFNKE